MRAIVITFAALNGFGLLCNLATLGSSKPWPRTKSETADITAFGAVVNGALLAWAAFVLFA